jgi:predicted ATPase
MIYLQSLSLSSGDGDAFPFSIPAIRSLGELGFEADVTFFAGGNGTGKSTLLEALAVASNRILVGDGKFGETSRELAEALTLSWKKKTHGGFFLRAEDFLIYKRSLTAEISDLRATANAFAGEIKGDYGLQLAQDSARGQASQLAGRYGEDLDAMSHGESFLQFFRARFTRDGLYLLDEPDTALSAQSVLGLVSALLSMSAERNVQFIIATHNPILLALPDAQIFDFDREPVAGVAWEDLEQVTLVRDFLQRPATYLRHLSPDD